MNNRPNTREEFEENNRKFLEDRGFEDSQRGCGLMNGTILSVIFWALLVGTITAWKHFHLWGAR